MVDKYLGKGGETPTSCHSFGTNHACSHVPHGGLPIMLAMASDEHQRLICHGRKLDKVCVECSLALFLRFQPQRPVSMASFTAQSRVLRWAHDA
jgi:hypothetical protein